jgi:hypothetical protein
VYRSWWGNRKEIDHWGNLGVNVRIILGWICGKRCVYSVLVVKPEERVHWGDPGVDVCRKLGWICGVMGVIRVLVWKLDGKRPLCRPRRRWVDNIRMDLWGEVSE